MKTMSGTAFALAALAAFAAQSASDQKKGSLKQQLVGAWTMLSNTFDQDGKKSEPFGPGAKGSVILTSNGRVAVVITRADLPKVASNNRTTATPEESQAIVSGSIAYFGTYTVNEPEKTLVMQLEGSTFPNWTGGEQKRMIEISGDEMKFTNKAPSMGAGTVTVTWKRVKEGTKTASR